MPHLPAEVDAILSRLKSTHATHPEDDAAIRALVVKVATNPVLIDAELSALATLNPAHAAIFNGIKAILPLLTPPPTPKG